MEYVPIMIGFRSERRVRESHVQEIPFPLNGRAPSGFWNRKLEFWAEVICTHPPMVSKVVPDENLPSLHRSEFATALEKITIQRHAFNLKVLKPDPFPQLLLWGENVALLVLSGIANSRFRFRHADAHTLCFVHRGQGRIATDFGLLHFDEGDFIVLPRGTTYAMESDSEITLLMYEFPQRILRPYHYWLEGYPFAATAPVPAEPVEIFNPPDPGTTEIRSVYIKYHHGMRARLEYPFSPFDAVAWEGKLYPFVLHLKDIRTLSSVNFHLDPKALTVFVTEDGAASVQAFLPRRVHSLPYPHQNYCTEILFNHQGYHARPEIKDGFLTLHPPGTFHGPDVRALARQRQELPDPPQNLPWRNEIGILLESKGPVAVLPAAEPLEVTTYENSWLQQYQEVVK